MIFSNPQCEVIENFNSSPRPLRFFDLRALCVKYFLLFHAKLAEGRAQKLAEWNSLANSELFSAPPACSSFPRPLREFFFFFHAETAKGKAQRSLRGI